MQLTVPGAEEIREILVKRVDQQKQAAGVVVGVVEPEGRRVVAHGNLANGYAFRCRRRNREAWLPARDIPVPEPTRLPLSAAS
ncbi:MAG TPA: hypothetical protein VG297_03015 [Bryobacteraceae bacterium]|jgi:hypothetical protein|nr:hypothetical protein [Bryobacteraceae bacterium]